MRLELRWNATRSPRWTSFTRRCFTTTTERPEAEATSQDGNTNSNKESKKKTHYLRETVFSGIQPTGVPHLGNYLGALRQWKRFQDEKTLDNPKARRNHLLYFCIVDLHALTSKQPRGERARLRKESFASLLAIGLDPQHSNLFLQSGNHFHAELMWILSTVASTGYLSRMTQWKSKLDLPENANLFDDEATQKLKLGLFSYPVLQAADILLYGTTLVPVGEDQIQHIEFARQLARSFNAHYGNDIDDKPVFTVPRAKISPAKRIMSLRDPTSKMSKSHPDPKSRILITDSPEEIHAKLKGSITDSEDGISYDLERRPGVSNLIEILSHVSDTSTTCEEIARDHQTMSKSAFKEFVGDQIIGALDGIRDNFNNLMQPNNELLRRAYHEGLGRAAATAGHRMTRVRNVVGFEDGWASKESQRRTRFQNMYN